MAAEKKRDGKSANRRRVPLLALCLAVSLPCVPGAYAAGDVLDPEAAAGTPSPTAFEATPTPSTGLSEDKVTAIWIDLTRNTSLNDLYASYVKAMQAVDAYVDAKNEGDDEDEARDATYFLVQDGITECETWRDALKPLSAAKRDWLVAAGRSTGGVDWAYRHAQEVADAWIRQLYICRYAVLYIDYIDVSGLQAFARAAVASSSAYSEHWYNMYLLTLLDFTDAETARQVLATYYTGEYVGNYESFVYYWTEDQEVLLERTAQAWTHIEDSLDRFLRPTLQVSIPYPWPYAYLAYAAGRTEYALKAIDLALKNPNSGDDALVEAMKTYCTSLQAYLQQQLETGDNRPFAFVYGVKDPGDSLLELGDILVTLGGAPIPAKSTFLQEVGTDSSTVQVYRYHAGGFAKHEFQLVIDVEATHIAFFPALENLE